MDSRQRLSPDLEDTSEFSVPLVFDDRLEETRGLRYVKGDRTGDCQQRRLNDDPSASGTRCWGRADRLHGHCVPPIQIANLNEKVPPVVESAILVVEHLRDGPYTSGTRKGHGGFGQGV